MILANQREPSYKDKILLVMKSPGNQKAISHLCGEQHLDFVAVDDEASLAKQLQEPWPPGFALVDVAGLDKSIWRICESLRHASVPFVVPSPPQAIEASSTALAYK